MQESPSYCPDLLSDLTSSNVQTRVSKPLISSESNAAAPYSEGTWIYSLPGSRLGLRRSAGALPLESLASDGGDPPSARVWIFYGPPDDALLELVDGQGGSGASIFSWQAEMEWAAQAKRRWRHRIQLVNLGCSSPEMEERLQRELPELEKDVQRRRQAFDFSVPDPVLQATTQAVLQLTPTLLNAYLNLESWADRYGREVDAARWRQAPAGEQLLQALRHWDEHQDAMGDRDGRLKKLEWCQRRDREERELLVAHLHQLERELDHYVDEHERLVLLERRVEDQLMRARALLESGRRAAPTTVRA